MLFPMEFGARAEKVNWGAAYLIARRAVVIYDEDVHVKSQQGFDTKVFYEKLPPVFEIHRHTHRLLVLAFGYLRWLVQNEAQSTRMR